MLTLKTKMKRENGAARMGGLLFILFTIGLLLFTALWLEDNKDSALDNSSRASNLDRQLEIQNEGSKIKALNSELVMTSSNRVKPLNQSIKELGDKEQVLAQSLTEYADSLERSEGKVIRALLANFWSECEAKNNCEYLLKSLISLLDKQEYRMLASFRRLEQERQTLMGLEVISHDASLSEKVAQVKYVDAQIWGTSAERLFADQYRQYELRLASMELEDVADGQDYVEQYNQLIAEQVRSSSHNNADASEGMNSQAAYEQAMNWLPQGMSATERSRAQAMLANQYLTVEQSSAITARIQEVEVQTEIVRDYQTELQKLKQALSAQRVTTHATMNDVQWQTYYDEQVYSFRVSFFNG